MNVLILGASGPLGRALTREALRRDHHVTAFVRDRSRFDFAAHRSLRIAEGDVLEPGALDRPLLDQHAVICTLGVKQTRDPVTLFSEGTDNVIRAMQRHNVRRLICVTGIGAGDSVGHGGLVYDWISQPFFLKTIYEDKTRQEELVQHCDRDWTIVRPARLTDGRARRRFAAVQNVRGLKAGSITRSDVAVWTVEQLNADKYLYKTVVLTE